MNEESETVRPPDWEFFDHAGSRAGAKAIRLRLGGMAVALTGLDDGLAATLATIYAPLAEPGLEEGSPALTLDLCRDPRETFIPRPARAERNVVLLDGDGRRFRYLGHSAAGRFDLADRTGRIVLASSEWEPAARVIENVLLAAVAWLARREGGALLHAASAARSGRGYLFYGSSGAGKSTLSASGARRGVSLSDDLSLVLPGPGGRLEIVPHRFRPHLRGAPVAEAVPLSAAFRLVQSASARVERVARPLAFSGLLANLPFVTDLLPRLPEELVRLEADFAALPLAWLHFTTDDSFWDAIEESGL